MAIDQLSDDFVAAYADWLGVAIGEARQLLEEEPLEDVTGDRLTAAGVEYTGGGGMVCLYPKPEEAEAIAREGGQPADSLHVTLLFFPEGVPDNVDEALAGLDFGGLSGEVTGIARFKEGEDGVPIVALISAPGLGNLRAELARRLPGYSENYDFMPHVTLGYDKVEDAEGALGLPVTFDAVKVKNKGDDEPRDVLQAAAWDESKHPRHPAGSERGGQFAPLYHVAPTSQRENIQREGLQDKLTGKGVFLWETPEDATVYQKLVGGDIWEVNPEGIPLEADPWWAEDPGRAARWGAPGKSVVSRQPVPPENLRRQGEGPVEVQGESIDSILKEMGAFDYENNPERNPERFMVHPKSGFNVARPGVVYEETVGPGDGKSPPRVREVTNGEGFAPPPGFEDAKPLGYGKYQIGGERPPKYLFRAVSEAEYQSILKNGYMQSDQRMNLSQEEGTVVALSDPRYYLPGALASDKPGTYEGRVIRIKYRDEDGWRHDTDDYVKTNKQVPLSQIDAVTPKLTRQVTKRPDKSWNDIGNYELTAAGWDPAKHPRHPPGSEKGGEFAPKAEGGQPIGGMKSVEETMAAIQEDKQRFVAELEALPDGTVIDFPEALAKQKGMASLGGRWRKQQVGSLTFWINELDPSQGKATGDFFRLLPSEILEPLVAPNTFVGEQGFERGPGRVRIAGERPRTPVGEIFAQAPAASLEAAVSDWEHLREQRPDMETVDVNQLVPTQPVVSAVRVEEYLQELQQEGNLPELLDSVRVVEGDDGRLYIADGHNRVAAAMRTGRQELYLPVIRQAKPTIQYQTEMTPIVKPFKLPKTRGKNAKWKFYGELRDETGKRHIGGIFRDETGAIRVLDVEYSMVKGEIPRKFTGKDFERAGVERISAAQEVQLYRLKDGIQAAGFDESEHPRWPKGHPDGGQFRPKEGEPGYVDPVADAQQSVTPPADALGSARDPNWEGPQLEPRATEFEGKTFDMVENSDRVWDGETNPLMIYDIDLSTFEDAVGTWSQLPGYQSDVEEMMRHVGEEGELRTTTTFEALESIMDDEPRFKSQFETASSGGAFLPPVRAAQEEMFFGYPKDLPVEQRPIYGWLEHPDATEDYSQYGEVTWFFKPELKARTTVSFIDSLSRPIIPGPIRNPGYRATVPPGYRDLHGWVSDHVNETGLFDGDAIETQMHGGVTLDDVQAVRVQTASWGRWSGPDYAKLRRWRAQLRQQGIIMEVVDENGDVPEEMR